MKAPLLIVAHGHGQDVDDPNKGLDKLIARIKDVHNIEVWEYEWDSDYKLAAANIIRNNGRSLIGIAYSWGNPWLVWLMDRVFSKAQLQFGMVFHIGPVSRQPGFPYSIRQLGALLQIGAFKTSAGARRVHSFRQVNDRPAEKVVIAPTLNTHVHKQFTFGTVKNLEKYSGKAGVCKKKQYPTRDIVDNEIGHATIDDCQLVHDHVCGKLKMHLMSPME